MVNDVEVEDFSQKKTYKIMCCLVFHAHIH